MGRTAAAMRQVLPGAEAVAMSLRISEIPPVWKDIYVGIYHIYMTYILYIRYNVYLEDALRHLLPLALILSELGLSVGLDLKHRGLKSLCFDFCLTFRKCACTLNAPVFLFWGAEHLWRR